MTLTTAQIDALEIYNLINTMRKNAMTLTTAQIDELEIYNLTQSTTVEQIHIDNIETDIEDYDMSDIDRETLKDERDDAAEFLREAQIEAEVDAYLEDGMSEEYADAVLEADQADWDAVASFCDC